MTDLASLPVEHPLRNTPLNRIKVFHKFRGENTRPKECSTWFIGPHTYNELDEFWGKLGEFLIEERP